MTPENDDTNIRSIDDAHAVRVAVQRAYRARATAAGTAPDFAEMIRPKRTGRTWVSTAVWRPAAIAACLAALVGAFWTTLPDEESGPGLDAEFATVTRWQAPTDRYLGLPFQDYQTSVPSLAFSAGRLGSARPQPELQR